MKTRMICLMVAVLVAATSVNTALAQRPASSKVTGNAYNFYSGGLHTRHATEHARVVQLYSENPGTVPADAVKHHAEQVQKNVAAAKSALAKAKPLAKDKESQDLVKAIEAHYADCDAHCKKLMAGGMDEKAMAACCGDLVKSLEAAQADHDKLMKKQGIEPLKPAAEIQK